MTKLRAINKRIEFYDVWDTDGSPRRLFIDWYEVQGLARTDAVTVHGDKIKDGTLVLLRGGHEVTVGISISTMVKKFRNSRIQRYVNIVGKKWS